MNSQSRKKLKRPRKPIAEEGKPGHYDSRNKLNDLTGKDWLLLTRSYWETEPSSEDRTAFAHPAPFMVRDVEKLISLFTKKGMTVLDPFVGSGTTILAALKLGRKAVGIDLNPKFKELARRRLAEHGYCTIIISDFTVNKVEVSVQSDIVCIMRDIGFEFSGTTVLFQPVKPLFPFGYPYAYKINHHHQNIMTFRKRRAGMSKSHHGPHPRKN